MEPVESLQLAVHDRLPSGRGHRLRSESSARRNKNADRKPVGAPQAVAMN